MSLVSSFWEARAWGPRREAGNSKLEYWSFEFSFGTQKLTSNSGVGVFSNSKLNSKLRGLSFEFSFGVAKLNSELGSRGLEKLKTKLETHNSEFRV